VAMPALAMECAIRTEVGRRANNEDAAFGSERLVAVADGVGGATAGEVASRTVIYEMAHLDKRRLSGDLADELRQAVVQANATLGFLISCRPQLAGMGTTLTAVALSNDGRYLIANVGDSRTYLYRDGRLVQLTRDQSFVQTLIDRGAITREQARDHPQRSVVLEALDGTDRGGSHVTSCGALCGDRLLLCSDGLSDVVADQEIAAALDGTTRDVAAQRLVALALRAGGRDNVSVVVADVLARTEPTAAWLDILPPR
jgi:serine/threonine protein phosphatase PrpC